MYPNVGCECPRVLAITGEIFSLCFFFFWLNILPQAYIIFIMTKSNKHDFKNQLP